MIEFQPWAKISRLYRDMVITEKIDGTNGAIGILEGEFLANWQTGDAIFSKGCIVNLTGDNPLAVYAQSRKNIITPAKDNHGFARWVWDNAEALVDVLGPGLHFGEWWGSGIQRGYGLTKGEKRFSLFNTKRWKPDPYFVDKRLVPWIPGLCVVPVLYEGPFDTGRVNWVKNDLRKFGSVASPGYMNPEGVVIYHTAGNVMFKSTLVNDDVPKEVVKAREENANTVARVLDVPKEMLGLAA